MGRTKAPARSVREIVEEPATTEEILQEEAEAAEFAEMQERIAEFQAAHSGKGWWIYVDKWDSQDHKWKMADRFPLDGFDHFIVRERFGPGKYRSRLLDNSYHYIKQGGSLEFEFTAPIPEPVKKEDDKNDDPLKNPIVAMMIESQKSQSGMLMELLKVMVPAQMGAGAAPKGTELIVLIEALSKLNALSPKDTGIKSIEDSLKLTKLIRESLDDGGNAKEGSILSEIRDLLELAPALRAQFAGKVLPPGSPQPALSPELPPRRFMARDPENKSPVLDAILPIIPEFAEAARTNQPIEKWADYLLEVLDEKIMPVLLPEVRREKGVPASLDDEALEDMIYDGLIERAEKPEEFSKVFLFAPALKPYETWVGRVVDEAVRKELLPENAEVVPEPSKENNGQSGTS